MTAKYPQAFIEQALVKAFSRGSKSITLVAEELNVNHHTLRYWMKNKSATPKAAAVAKEKRPQDWTPAEQLVALQETHGLTPETVHTDMVPRKRHLRAAPDELEGRVWRTG